MYVLKYSYMYASMYVFMYECMYVCMYVCTHTVAIQATGSIVVLLVVTAGVLPRSALGPPCVCVNVCACVRACVRMHVGGAHEMCLQVERLGLRAVNSLPPSPSLSVREWCVRVGARAPVERLRALRGDLSALPSSTRGRPPRLLISSPFSLARSCNLRWLLYEASFAKDRSHCWHVRLEPLCATWCLVSRYRVLKYWPQPGSLHGKPFQSERCSSSCCCS